MWMVIRDDHIGGTGSDFRASTCRPTNTTKWKFSDIGPLNGLWARRNCCATLHDLHAGLKRAIAGTPTASLAVNWCPSRRLAEARLCFMVISCSHEGPMRAPWCHTPATWPQMWRCDGCWDAWFLPLHWDGKCPRYPEVVDEHCPLFDHEVKEIQSQETNVILGSSVVVLGAMILGKQVGGGWWFVQKRNITGTCLIHADLSVRLRILRLWSLGWLFVAGQPTNAKSPCIFECSWVKHCLSQQKHVQTFSEMANVFYCNIFRRVALHVQSKTPVHPQRNLVEMQFHKQFCFWVGQQFAPIEAMATSSTHSSF